MIPIIQKMDLEVNKHEYRKKLEKKYMNNE